VPYVSYASNFLWVLVLGLIGPSIPAIIRDLGISYPQAGLFFTMLSIGSLLGTLIGGIASDYLNRKALFIFFSLCLCIGLVLMGAASTYMIILILILLFSLLGSPIGALGQSIMLHMFPESRERNLSFQTMFAAAGSFLAPFIVSFTITRGLNWRWSFMEAGILSGILLIVVIFYRFPKVPSETEKVPIGVIFKNKQVIISAVFIFFSIALDIGFSYWLAEYFKTELGVRIGIASMVVGVYLAGVMTGRFIISLYLKKMKPLTILQFHLSLSVISLIFFITLPVPGIKAVFCYLYGFGIGPLFPLMLAKGAETYPDQPGAVTGFLFSWMSLGGMVFPLLIGSMAEVFGIQNSYYFNVAVGLGVLITLSIWLGNRKQLKTT